jgi:undecaprenyl-diphosphatase
MDTLSAVLLGLVQGLTEFLPVSSSAHLTAAEALLGVKSPPLLSAVALHCGTLLSILIVFGHDLWAIGVDGIRGCWTCLQRGDPKTVSEKAPLFGTAAAIVVGTIPAGIAGVLLHEKFERAFGSLTAGGAFLMVTGLFLLASRLAPKPKVDRVGAGRGFLIGVAQAVAILPGISRSGSTIVAGCMLGVDRRAAGRFAFLLAVPALAGAAALEVLRNRQALFASAPGGRDSLIQVGTLAAGALVAAVVGTICLIILLRIIERGRLHWFAAYCLPAGAAMAIAGMLR